MFEYAEDIAIIVRTKRDATAAFSAIEREPTEMDLAVNEGITKYMLSTSRVVRRIDSQLTTDNYTFDIVREFIYFGFAVTTKNSVSLGIKHMIMMSNRDLSRTIKLILYKRLILPVFFYGSEAWTLLSTEAVALACEMVI